MLFFHMDLDTLLRNARLTRAVLGVTPEEFDALLALFAPVLFEHRAAKRRKRAVGGGANGHIKSARQKLAYILFYLKTYPTYDVAAFVCGASKSRTQAWTQAILPLLETTLGRTFVLPKRRIGSVEEFFAAFPEVREVMLDGVERPTVRSQKNKTQRKHYSGKKKRHMRKSVVVTTAKKQILFLSPATHGRVHDKKLADKHLLPCRIPDEVAILADTGFQGLQHSHPNTLLPKKRPPKGTLTDNEKAMNRLISSARIVVEHAIGGMKRFRAVSDIFRNRRGQDDAFMTVAAGLWNFHLRMTT